MGRRIRETQRSLGKERMRCVLARRTLVTWTVLIVALATSHASAQVNVEKFRTNEDQSGFSGSLGFDVSARGGNVELLQFGILGRLSYVGAAVTTFLVGNTDLGWEAGKRFSNEALLHLRQVYRRGSRLRPEAFVQVNYNESRLLTFRWLVGGGLRTALYRTETTQFWWGSAYMFEYERLDLGADAVHPRRTSVHRSSNYLSSKVGLNGQSALFWTIYIQPRFDDPEDVRILNEARLGVELNHSLSLAMTLRMHYDSRPPDGKHSLDTALKSGIAIDF